MKQNSRDLSPSQFVIMNVIWDAEDGITVTDVLNAINCSREEKLKRTTVQVQMERLEEKGWLRHRKVGNTFLYYATRERDDALSTVTKNMRSRLFDGSIKDLVKCLFDHSSSQKKDIDEIKDLLKEYQNNK